jgi:hypothetical protein
VGWSGGVDRSRRASKYHLGESDTPRDDYRADVGAVEHRAARDSQ